LNEALKHFRESSDRFPVISRSAITRISRASATENQRYSNRYRPHTFSATVRTETRPRPPESRPSKVGHKPFTLTYSFSLGKFSFLHVQSELGAIHGDHNISSSCSTDSKWFINQNQKTYEKTLEFATKSKQNHDGVFRILIHIIPMRIINRRRPQTWALGRRTRNDSDRHDKGDQTQSGRLRLSSRNDPLNTTNSNKQNFSVKKPIIYIMA
jgi:hypothetical protein